MVTYNCRKELGCRGLTTAALIGRFAVGERWLHRGGNTGAQTPPGGAVFWGHGSGFT